MYVKNSLWHFPLEIKDRKKEIRKWPDLPWANSQEKSAISYVGDVASHSSDCEMSYKILSHENEGKETEERSRIRDRSPECSREKSSDQRDDDGRGESGRKSDQSRTENRDEIQTKNSNDSLQNDDNCKVTAITESNCYDFSKEICCQEDQANGQVCLVTQFLLLLLPLTASLQKAYIFFAC